MAAAKNSRKRRPARSPAAVTSAGSVVAGRGTSSLDIDRPDLNAIALELRAALVTGEARRHEEHVAVRFRTGGELREVGRQLAVAAGSDGGEGLGTDQALDPAHDVQGEGGVRAR